MKTLVAWLIAALALPVFAADPLPSWNDGKAKQSIVDFVAKVTKEGSPDFVPVAERIATFDNDGTLWAEQPMYFQFLFAVDRVKATAAEHPEWKDQEPFKSVLTGDLKRALAGGEHALLELVAGTHAGMTTEDGIATAKHPKTGRLLHGNGLSADARTARVSARERLQDVHCFRRRHRVHARLCGEGLWHPARARVGSTGKQQLEMRDGKPVLVKLPAVEFIDDKGGQAHRHPEVHRPPPHHRVRQF